MHEQIPVSEYTQQAYHSYATYVILDRAIPRLEDGLKPVQRRILYAMSQLGLKSISKPKKSARTVGDVLGKFHPHSDTACYEAMVLMAQSFSYRYPFIDGQGNWGAIDEPKSFASMRYTEAKLSPYAQLLLDNLNPHTTEWGPNFDGTLQEPLVLPAGLPNILLNGGSGIAVGIATDIPPFNLKEVGQACIALLENENLTLDQLVKILPGPDYPTGAEVINTPSELKSIIKSGMGQIKQRAVFEKGDGMLTIKELPFQTTSTKIIQQIADLMIAKKLPAVKNIRDESDEQSPVSIVLTLRSNRVKEEEILPILFSETDLERSHKVNITYINPDRKPVQTGVLDLLKHWLICREQSFLKQLNHELSAHQERLHILDGLLLILDNIDQVIKIIRYEDDPLLSLQETFSLSEEQARAILEIRLKQLAKLEMDKLEKEHAMLTKEVKRLKQLIKDPQKRKEEMIRIMEGLIDSYGDERRSVLIERSPYQKQVLLKTLPKDPCLVILSKKGWIRAAKSHDFDLSQLSFKADDKLSCTALGHTDNPTILFDEKGIAFSLPSHELPTVRGHGDPVTKYISTTSPITKFMLNEKPSTVVFLASKLGYGFLSTIQDIFTRNRAGKKVFSVNNTAIASIQALSEDKTQLALITQQGRLLIVPMGEIPKLSKGKGNKLVQIHKKDHEEKTDGLSQIMALKDDDTLVLKAGKRIFKLPPTDWKAYAGTRGQRGLLLPRGFRRITQASID